MSTQMPAHDPYALTSWGQPTTFQIDCPSGQKCLARKLDLPDLAGLGLIEQFDMLSDIAAAHDPVKKAKKKPQDRKVKAAAATKAEAAAEKLASEKFMRELFGDKEKFSKFSIVVDKMIAAAVIRPALTLSYAQDVNGIEYKISAEDRIEGKVYTDSIGFADKMHVWEAVFDFEQSEIAAFREKSEAPVGSMETEPSVSGTT